MADIAPLVPMSRGTEAGGGRDRCVCMCVCLCFCACAGAIVSAIEERRETTRDCLSDNVWYVEVG